MTLTKDGYERACEFVRTVARPLDQALFRYHFEDGPKDDVLMELVSYQNMDGGFGNGIEPDFTTKGSSPMATSVGLQYFIEVGGNPDSDIVRSAIDYLVSTYDSSQEYWPATFKDVNNAPHAPWWHVDEITPPKEENWANPNAELAGYFNLHHEFVPSDLLAQVNRRVMTNLENNELITGSLYNLLCWNRVHSYFPEPLSSEIRMKIGNTINTIVPILAEKMGEIRVFMMVSSSENLFLSYPGLVYDLLLKEIANQANDGGWWPTWKWGQYENFWNVAEKEWAGKMTYECLRSLHNLNLNNSLIEKLD